MAKRMIKFIEVSTIGVSKESQLRAAKILEVIYEGCENGHANTENFFQYGQCILTTRWNKLRDVLKQSDLFSLANYPTLYCNFTGEFTTAHPGNYNAYWPKSLGEVRNF